MDILIKAGLVFDPSSNLNRTSDLLIIDGKISAIKSKIKPPRGIKQINAKGLLVLPGFVDMHCHLRDPGDPEDETVESGSKAAAAGGFTSIACMANTSPALDNPAMIKYIKEKTAARVNVFPIGAITKNLEGKQLTEMGRMIGEGAVAFSDDGKTIADAGVMRLALEYLKQFNVPAIAHCEDAGLSSGGQMNEGYHSTIWGLKGIPAIAEETIVQRDIMLARDTGAHVHIAHVSTAGSVRLIREAKEKGIKISCETCPHYFSLSEAAVEGYNTMAKVNPPLRADKDVKAVIRGLKDGVIDVIATDHAPHKIEKKNVEFAQAANGMVGLETALPLIITELVGKRHLTLRQVLPKITVNPAKILGLKKGTLKIGADADVAIIDPKAEITVEAKRFASKSKNSPFDGWKLKGKVIYTIVGGRIAYSNA